MDAVCFSLYIYMMICSIPVGVVQGIELLQVRNFANSTKLYFGGYSYLDCGWSCSFIPRYDNRCCSNLWGSVVKSYGTHDFIYPNASTIQEWGMISSCSPFSVKWRFISCADFYVKFWIFTSHFLGFLFFSVKCLSIWWYQNIFYIVFIFGKPRSFLFNECCNILTKKLSFVLSFQYLVLLIS